MKIFLTIILSFFFFNVAQAAPDSCLYYFYNDSCSDCQKVEPLIEALQEEYTSLEIRKVLVNESRDDLYFLFDKYNVNYIEQGVPAVFIGTEYYIGSKEIINNLRGRIQYGDRDVCPVLLSQSRTVGLTKDSNDNNIISTVAVGLIVLLALGIIAIIRQGHQS